MKREDACHKGWCYHHRPGIICLHVYMVLMGLFYGPTQIAVAMIIVIWWLLGERLLFFFRVIYRGYLRFIALLSFLTNSRIYPFIFGVSLELPLVTSPDPEYNMQQIMYMFDKSFSIHIACCECCEWKALVNGRSTNKPFNFPHHPHTPCNPLEHKSPDRSWLWHFPF